MSTNYYFVRERCPTCGRSDNRVHIGKSSGGWTFCFRAHEQIRSYADWLNFFTFNDGAISEADTRIISVEEFKAVVDRASGGMNHARIFGRCGELTPAEAAYVERHGFCDVHDRAMNFLDAEGHSFTDREFC